MSCLFCRIVNGEIKSEKVYEDEKIIAFKDIHPKAPTHILFVPKKHYATLNDVPAGDTIMSDVIFAIQKVTRQLGLADRGYRIVTNVNSEGGQVVFHLHVHMLGGRILEEKMG